MARTKTTEMSTITAAQLADGDWVPVVDVSDTTMSSTGTNKKLAKSQLAEAAGVTAHLADTSDAHDASAISFSATGNIVATDVQAAIAELDSEKIAAATLATNGNLLTRAAGVPAEVTRPALAADSAFTAQFITPCANGTSSTTARPTSSGVVMWVGAVEPENMAAGDIWIQSELSPLDFPDLSMWFDASVASSITSSGGAVSQWSDLSGNARHATQSTAGAKPTTGSSTVNTLNALSFDGGDELATASLADASDRTTYVVVDANSHDATRRVIIEGSTGTLAYSQLQMEIGAGNQLTALGHDNSTNVYTATAAGTFSTSPQIATYRRTDGGTIKIYEGDTEAASVAIGAVSDSSSTYATIGNARPSTGGRQFKGLICEILDFTTAHTANQRAAVWNYLADKWGITL